MPKKEQTLDVYRVLDLTDEKGFLCGKILGDLGADVIKIEPPGGDLSRNRGPFYKDIPHAEKSLFWLALNTSKRGITLNLDTSDGRDIFKRLVKTADFIIESFSPGHMEGLGLDYETLCQLNPRVIMISISPFGQTGPHKDYKASDIVIMARGGLMYIYGDRDRPPVRVSFPQAYLHASAAAAVGGMTALLARRTTGRGQWVDVSAQRSAVSAMYNIRPFWDLNKVIMRRSGPFRMGLSANALQRQTWPCKDGFVTFVMIGGKGGAKTNKALVQWMDEEGMADELLKEKDWEAWDMAGATQEELDRLAEPISRFFMTYTMGELYEGSQNRKIMLHPAQTTRDIRESPQLAGRDFWRKIDHPELKGTITYPGPFVKLSETPCDIRCKAPLIGEHNIEVYGELGLRREELVMMKQAGII